MKKILIILFFNSLIAFDGFAGTDGENALSKKNPGEIKECFKSLNKGIFAFNQGLDKAIFKPVASAYLNYPAQ